MSAANNADAWPSGLAWGAYQEIDRDSDLNDPLGLRAAELVAANALFPHLTAGSRRARTLGLYLVGIALAEEVEDSFKAQRDAFRVFEHFCVHSLAVDEGYRAKFVSLSGVRSARGKTKSGSSWIDLGQKIGRNGVSSLWSHRRLARAAGLVDWEREDEWPTLSENGSNLADALLPKGELATLLERLLRADSPKMRTSVARLWRDEWIDKSLHWRRLRVLKDALYSQDHENSPRYYERMSLALSFGSDTAFRRSLPESAQAAWSVALALGRLVCGIEDRFRGAFGVVENFEKSIGPVSRHLADLGEVAAYLRSKGTAESERALPLVEALTRCLSRPGRSPSWSDLYLVHQVVAAGRGREPWELEIGRPERLPVESSDDDEDGAPEPGEPVRALSSSEVEEHAGPVSPIVLGRLMTFRELRADFERTRA